MDAEDIADLCEAALSGGKSSLVDLAVVKSMVAKSAMSRSRRRTSGGDSGGAMMMDGDDAGDTSFETMLGIGNVSRF